MKFDPFITEYDISYRLYAFVNVYLSSIQQGIQTGHAAVDLVRKYAESDDKAAALMVTEWADKHKTFVTLNGGNNATLAEILEITKDSGLPWVSFNEDDDSLGGIMTAVAVIVPDTFFNAQFAVDSKARKNYSWTRIFADTRDGHVYHSIATTDPIFPFLDMLKLKGLAK